MLYFCIAFCASCRFHGLTSLKASIFCHIQAQTITFPERKGSVLLSKNMFMLCHLGFQEDDLYLNREKGEFLI